MKAILDSLSPWIFTAFTIVTVIVIYIWFASSGRWIFWKSNTYYYDGLARGFISGHLYLPIEPDPNLLKLSNPYDPIARKEAGQNPLLDLSLYNGKFYLYWGPVPALILSVIYPIFHGKAGDLALAFSFVCGTFLVQTALLHFLWRQYFGNLPGWILYISILAMGLIGPLVLLRHINGGAEIYEASISGAQFFFMAGMLAALTMLDRPLVSNWKLALAGFLFALAIGTRLTIVLPASFMALLLALIFKADVSFPKKAMHLAFLGVPLLFVFLALGWYNWARFGSFTETGLYYQLAGFNLQKNFSKTFSHLYIFQNIYNFLFTPVLGVGA